MCLNVSIDDRFHFLGPCAFVWVNGIWEFSMSCAEMTMSAVDDIFCPLQRCHNGRDGVSNHQLHDCLLKRLFRHRSKNTSNHRVIGPCGWEFTGERGIPRTNGQ